MLRSFPCICMRQSSRLAGLCKEIMPWSVGRTETVSRVSTWMGDRERSLYLLSPEVVSVGWARGMAKKGKNRSKPIKSSIDDMIDELSDDEDDVAENEDAVEFKETQLSNFLKQKHPGKKPTKGSVPIMKYHEFVAIVSGESLWKELEAAVDKLKSTYIHQLNVRSSTSLDEIQVLLEGDTYPLNEIAAISKKDPKKLIIDASAFPQAAPNILASIRESGMNLNPQQDGLTIFVPIPRVTKEFREKLAGGARKKLNDCKDELRSIQNKYTKRVSEMELSGEVSKDDSKAAADLIKVITDNFLSAGDQLLVSKTKEVMGK
eukprot:GFUD01026093.1.p1 GENE.GFUD01026093.1~~GFUD01026093.1.p1  ORF type:complete len:319 (+),score=111.30 GFUD01026093.1:40-996(+)